MQNRTVPDLERSVLDAVLLPSWSSAPDRLPVCGMGIPCHPPKLVLGLTTVEAENAVRPRPQEAEWPQEREVPTGRERRSDGSREEHVAEAHVDHEVVIQLRR